MELPNPVAWTEQQSALGQDRPSFGVAAIIDEMPLRPQCTASLILNLGNQQPLSNHHHMALHIGCIEKQKNPQREIGLSGRQSEEGGIWFKTFLLAWIDKERI